MRNSLLAALVAVSVGCSSSTTGADGGADAASGGLFFSCDYVKGGSHLLCTDYDYPASLASTADMVKAQCKPPEQTVGVRCNTANSVGGCRRLNSGAQGFTTTVWSYTGTAAQAMAGCTMGGTYVPP
jgi:hypothetical protein